MEHARQHPDGGRITASGQADQRDEFPRDRRDCRRKTRWGLAGDQLFVDFDISAGNVPPGTHLAIGSAVIEVTAQPHIGCAKFVQRFGVDAMKFVNSPKGRALHLRGINARVVVPRRIQTGDRIKKLEM